VSTIYPEGLTQLGDGLHAYLQPDGSWGLSNAGLIVGDGESLLVDTLYDLGRTRAMLEAMAKADPGAKTIDTVVNTHANGDHCWGNDALPSGAEIIASSAGAAEMAELPPRQLAMLVKLSRATVRYGAPMRGLLRLLGAFGLRKAGAIADAAPFVVHAFDRYDWDGVGLREPTRTFDGELTLDVGGRAVELVEVGPAHTQGDVLVHVPDSKTVFTGDILFSGAHPIVWAGPFSNWIAACDRILAWEPERVVPGHGPLATVDEVRRGREYLVYVFDEAKKRRAAGMGFEEAARDIALEGFGDWSEAERIVVNVRMAYSELDSESAPPDAVALFASMAAYWQEANG